MKKNKTTWQIITEFVNRQKKNALITRPYLHTITDVDPRTSSYGTSVDNYRRILTILGVLRPTAIRGVYAVENHIDESVGPTLAKQIAYDWRGDWKSWFMKPEVIKEIE